MSEPAYRRMAVDERREQLLALGAELFGRYSFNELSMAQVAREAGISKPLLYHYFPSKREYFLATLAAGAGELATRTAPDPDLPPDAALRASVGAFLEWVDERRAAYRTLVASIGQVPEVGELVADVRDATAMRILAGLGYPDPPPPRTRSTVRSWLWLMDGAILDWIEHDDIARDDLADHLCTALSSLLDSATADRPGA